MRTRDQGSDNRRRFSTLPFVNLAINETQKLRHWPAHYWNVMSEQRQSNWQHPNSYDRQREETQHSGKDECDTNRHPHPYCALRTKAVQILTDPGRDVLLEIVYFLVEIGNPRHASSSDVPFGVFHDRQLEQRLRGSNRRNARTNQGLTPSIAG
jgi:hypothetical protein